MTTAKLFMNGRSQTARLARELRLSGNHVWVRRFGLSVPFEPAELDVDTWFEALDRCEEPFMPDGCEQPRTPDQARLQMRYLLDSNACIAILNERCESGCRMPGVGCHGSAGKMGGDMRSAAIVAGAGD